MAHGCLAYRGKRFGQQLIELFTVAETLAKFCGLRIQRLIGESMERFLQRIDVSDAFAKAFDQPLVTAARDGFDQGSKHELVSSVRGMTAIRRHLIFDFNRRHKLQWLMSRSSWRHGRTADALGAPRQTG